MCDKEEDVILFNDLMSYVVACGMSPTSDELLPVLETLGHQQLDNVGRNMAVEMMFYLQLPPLLIRGRVSSGFCSRGGDRG